MPVDSTLLQAKTETGVAVKTDTSDYDPAEASGIATPARLSAKVFRNKSVSYN